jgi:hypothetical protein
MRALLDVALHVHGGLERWREVYGPPHHERERYQRLWREQP